MTAAQSHRCLPLAARTGRSPTVSRFSVAPCTPLSGDCTLVAQLRKAGCDCRAALRLFFSRHVQPLFHAAIITR